ncbi:MAG: trypsin-like peptidase domain-containing protein [Gudongella sp.]|nr:trypsin-like peptidase domain-containing protein [Gudongella sp.]
MDDEKKREDIEEGIEKVEEDIQEQEQSEENSDVEAQTVYEDLHDEIEETTNVKPETNDFSKPARLSKKNWLVIIAVVLIFSFVGSFGGVYFGNQFLVPGNKELSNSGAVTINTNDSINTISAVVQKNIESVVGITTTSTQVTFFNQEDVSGVGSGVIVDEDGYILTNSHVVADGEAKEIKVLFEDGETVDGTIVWVDSLIDLAVIKVDKVGLTAAELGDSDKLVVGEIAIAIGNPLGLEFERTVTSGIISGLNRSVQVDQSNIIDYLIQTDASINPGNSGGPLLNAKGEVIAINTAKVTSAEGLGFAIPINQVKAVIDEIIETGKFQTVYMGITGVRVQEYEQRLGIKLEAETGVVIIEVEGNSPADKAGIIAGDVIQGIDENEVTNMGQLKRNLYQFKQGDSASIKFLRNGLEKNVEIEFSNVK